MPHLTEERWQALTGSTRYTFLALQAWPETKQDWIDDSDEQAFLFGIDSVRGLRNLRALSGEKTSERLPVGIHSGMPERQAFLEARSFAWTAGAA